jgi:hypothetical protein
MSMVIAKATINHNDKSDERVTLELRQVGANEFRWYGQNDDGSWHDTFIAGASVEDAKVAALQAWHGECWDLQADWLDY